MRNVSRIDIVLENCEVIGVLAENIGGLQVSGIYHTISRIASNSIRKITRCGSFSIKLLPTANVLTTYLTEWSAQDGGDLPFKRLQEHRDICAIDVIYDDGTNEHIFVPWGGYCEYTNAYQHDEITQDGSLRITIEETEEI